MFNDLAAAGAVAQWETLRQDGTALMLQGRYGKWMLPPDWLRVDRADGSLAIAPGWPPRFSWDAIRVPLHVAWGGIAAQPLLESFRRYWDSSPRRRRPGPTCAPGRSRPTRRPPASAPWPAWPSVKAI